MTVGIVGTGLMGGSLGLALMAGGERVIAWDPDSATLLRAVERRAATRAASSLDDLLQAECDIVVIAAPPGATIDILRSLDHGGLVTDVVGVKGAVVEAAAHLPRFVGGHPMAGRELGGIESASPALFAGAAWVVVADGAPAADVTTVESLARRVGARPLQMTADDHDAAVAAVSHLPQLLAVSLLEAISDDSARLELAAGSFRDLTRVASSDSTIWADLLPLNDDALHSAIDLLINGLLTWRHASSEEIIDRFAIAREARRRLAPPTSAVRVHLVDRPGEVARVGRALETSGVDLRDLQLRHSRHGGGGVLTLSVRPGEEPVLRSALEAEGLEIA